MMHPASPMELAAYDYDLPPEQIAQIPLAERSRCRLLVVKDEGCCDRSFADLPSCVAAGDLLVMNDTRVVNARLSGYKLKRPSTLASLTPTDLGGQVELLLERVVAAAEALVLIRASKPPKLGGLLVIGAGAALVEVVDRHPPFYRCRLLESQRGEVDWLTLCQSYGALPLPPYIERPQGPSRVDAAAYQTVYAAVPGAVAAPTAGLHFDQPLLDRLQAMGVYSTTLTLHVGAGTFVPIRSESLLAHEMHSESYHLPAACIAAIDACRQRGGKVIAVGTTSLRALEAAALADHFPESPLRSGWRQTDLFIYPGFRFRVVDRLITNLHLPRSTLLVLVSAFAGYDRIKSAYRQAVERNYRFFSFGDAMLLDRVD